MFLEKVSFIYKLFFPREKGLRVSLFLSLFFNFSFVFCSGFLPYLFKFSIDSYESKKLDSFVYFLLAYCALWFSSRVFLSFREVFIHPVIQRSISNLYQQTFHHIINLPYDFHTNKSTGEVGGKVDMSINAFPNIILPILFGFLPLILELIVSCAVLTYACGYEFGLGLLVTVFSIGFYSFKVSDKVQDKFHKAHDSRLTLQSKFIDSLLNFESAKIFGSLFKEFKLINKLSNKREKINTKSFQGIEYLRVIQIIFLFLGFAFILFLSIKKVVGGSLTLGDFIMIHAYLIHFTLPIERYIEMFKFLNIGLSKIKYVEDIFKQPIVQNSNKLKRSGLIEPLSIEFKNVWFGYEKRNPILKGVSFKINPGEIVCLTGKTGEGKSSIVKLIVGFYKPWSGKILVNGISLEKIDNLEFLKRLCIIPQDNLIYNDTFLENIKRVLSQDFSKEALDHALSLSLSDKILKKHKDGLDTNLGEKGIKLSGGEKQRIGFCRAFLKGENFWILDEATSALDKATEEKIIGNMVKKYKNKLTSLVITHKSSLLKVSNRVLEIREGQIYEKPIAKRIL